MEEVFTLEGDKKLLIIGPARVKILSGKVEVFGKEMGGGEGFIIKRYRALPLEVLESPSQVSITLGRAGRVEERGRIGCSFWRSLAKTVTEDPRDLLILGRVDSGKSSLAIFLINKCLGRGLKVGVIDADPGQGDIGVPGLIGSSIPEKPILSLEELKPFKAAFLGSTSPTGLEGRLERAVLHLFQDLKEVGCRPVLVVLHGWIVGGQAHGHILRLTTLLGIEAIASLGDDEVKILLEKFKGLEARGIGIQCIPGMEPNTYRRSMEQRRAIRNRKIRRYFSQTPFQIRHIRHGEIPIQGTRIFQGEKLSLKEGVQRWILEVTGMGRRSLIYGEGGNGRYKILVIDPESRGLLQYWRKTYQGIPLDIYATGKEMGLLAGFKASQGSYRIGRVESLDPLKKGWTFLVPRNMGKIRGIILGRMVVEREGSERRGLPKDLFS